MYIRIQDKTIRFRISRIEADRLLSGERFSDHLPLSIETKLIYAVQVTNQESFLDCQSKNNTIEFFINKNILFSEIEKRPTKKGIEVKKIIGNETILAYLEINLKTKK